MPVSKIITEIAMPPQLLPSNKATISSKKHLRLPSSLSLKPVVRFLPGPRLRKAWVLGPCLVGVRVRVPRSSQRTRVARIYPLISRKAAVVRLKSNS